MLRPQKGIGFLLTAFACLCLSALSSQAQTSQWTGPYASNNIYNNNTGYGGGGTTSPRTNLEVNGYIHATTAISVQANTFSGNAPVNGLTVTWLGVYGAFNIGAGMGFAYRFRTKQMDRLLITDTYVSIPGSHMMVGSTTDNGNPLQVNGNLWTTALQLPAGAAAGKILTSDASGNATWQMAAASSGGWA